MQLLIASFILVGLTAMRGGSCAIAAVGVLAVNGVLIGGRMFAMAGPPTSAEGAPIRIMTLNLLSLNRDYLKVREFIAEQDPDVLILQEFTHDWQAALAPVARTYPYAETQPQYDYDGMAIYARRAFTSEDVQASMLDEELVSIRAAFDDFTLYAVHPKAPVSKAMAMDNFFYLETVAELLANEAGPLIVAGDFNATPWSRGFGLLAAAGMKRSHVSPFAQTWPVGSRTKGIELDHILVKNVPAASSQVVCEDTGSDHCAVTGRVWITPRE